MDFKHRIKLALNALRGRLPEPRSTTVVEVRETVIPEPCVVLNNQLLYGKNVLVTGAGQNIGRSIALETAKQGANVFFTDIDESRRSALEQELSAYPIQSKGFLSDISNRQQTDQLCDFLKKSGIVIDILINNVGIQIEDCSIKALDLNIWNRVFKINLFGPMYLTKQITQTLLDRQMGGSIIFVTSIHQNVVRQLMSYSSSKAALAMMIRELALELAPFGIRVNGIAPGHIEEDEQGQPIQNPYVALHQTSINPCYIGRAIVYLASDYFSRFTTGTILKIDGGLSLHSYLSLLKI